MSFLRTKWQSFSSIKAELEFHINILTLTSCSQTTNLCINAIQRDNSEPTLKLLLSFRENRIISISMQTL
jgi:hypothetical protein